MNFNLDAFTHIIFEKLESWLHFAVAMFPNFLIACVFFTLFWTIGKLLRGGIKSLLTRTTDNPAISRMVSGAIQFFIVLIGLFVALGVLQLDKTVTSLLAGAGVIGLALGFAFQEIASNFIAGILLAFLRPYRAGDVIEVEGFRGKVSSLDLRSTSLLTFDGLEVIIPNKDMFTKPLVNYTSTPLRRVELSVGISYGEDLRKVEAVVRESLKQVAHQAKDHEIDFFYTGFGDSSINFSARLWIDHPDQKIFMQAVHEAIIFIKEAFDQESIVIPFPIRTLDFGIKGGVSLAEIQSAASTKAP